MATVFHAAHRPPSVACFLDLRVCQHGQDWPWTHGSAWQALCLVSCQPCVFVCSKCVQQLGRLMPPPAGGMEDLPSRSQDATASPGSRPVNTTVGTSLGLPRATSVSMCQPSTHSSRLAMLARLGHHFPWATSSVLSLIKSLNFENELLPNMIGWCVRGGPSPRLPLSPARWPLSPQWALRGFGLMS